MNPIMFPFYVHFEQQIKREKKKQTNKFTIIHFL